MQNRTVEIKCRLTQKEADSLNKRVKKSGLSRESYLRHLINGLVPTDAPPPDYFSMMEEQQVWSYVGELIFNMLVLVGMVKMADRVVREMMGL